MGKRKSFFVMSVCVCLSFLMISPAGALSEALEKLYSAYDILFYNAEQDEMECIKNWSESGGGENTDNSDADNGTAGDDTGSATGSGGNKWSGKCINIDYYGSKIEQYFDYIYKVAQNNGLPWEGIVAQLIGESSFMKHEACAYNPLGLKPGNSGRPSCDGRHAIFSSYEEAFSYYVNSIRPVREAMGKFTSDPYGYIDFLINGIPGYKYATDPNYVEKISGYACGVQNWARAHGKPLSGSGAPSGGYSGGGSGSSGGGTPYCRDDGNYDLGGGGNGGENTYDGTLVFYSQCDLRWRDYSYGKDGINGSTSYGTICSSGCGPTSFAVIAANLKGDNTITPVQTTDLAGKAGMHVAGNGSDHGITKYLANQYGLSATQISGNLSTINDYLDNGYMIHTSGSGGAPFTGSGHYIAIVKKLDNGNWLVADSSRRGPSGEYSPATVLAGMRKDNVWAVK